MCTTVPSGMVMSAGPAVKLTCCWPQATTPPNRRIPPTRTAAFNVSLKLLVRMGSLVVLVSVGLVDHKFPGINQHHHQHSAGENIVGGDFALVVGVPHEREAALVGWVGLRVARLEGSAARVRVRGSGRGAVGRVSAQSCIRTQIGRATVPSAICENVGTGQSR